MAKANKPTKKPGRRAGAYGAGGAKVTPANIATRFKKGEVANPPWPAHGSRLEADQSPQDRVLGAVGKNTVQPGHEFGVGAGGIACPWA